MIKNQATANSAVIYSFITSSTLTMLPLQLKMRSTSLSYCLPRLHCYCCGNYCDNNIITTNNNVNHHPLIKMKEEINYDYDDVEGRNMIKEKEELFVKMMREARPYVHAHRASTFVVVVPAFILDSPSLLHPFLQQYDLIS
ncbi:putative amino-acid acetyltransferase NAGS1 chloroplastic [Bienertia sinuspersici]